MEAPFLNDSTFSDPSMVRLAFQNVRSSSRKNNYAHTNVCAHSNPCGLVVQISSACAKWKRKKNEWIALNSGCFNLVHIQEYPEGFFVVFSPCSTLWWIYLSPMSQRRGTDHSSRLLLCLPHQTNAASALRGSTTVLCSAGYFRSCTETRRSRSTTAWSSKSTCFWTGKGWVTDISRSRLPQITAINKWQAIKKPAFYSQLSCKCMTCPTRIMILTA